MRLKFGPSFILILPKIKKTFRSNFEMAYWHFRLWPIRNGTGTEKQTFVFKNKNTQKQFRNDILTQLTLVLLNKLRCHAYFEFTANQLTWSRLLLWIHILNVKQCRPRSVGFFRSQLIWIYTVCKGRVYPGSAGQGLRKQFRNDWLATCTGDWGPV